MRNFIKSLLSNRFGIIMSAINMCLLINIFLNQTPGHGFSTLKVIVGLNMPALIFGIFSLEVFNALFLNIPSFTFINSAQMILPLFVPIQWLFIGWLAKTIAQKLKTKTN